MRKVELLAPAKDRTVGMAAIDNGADAVYIGAPAFGARQAASNSIEDVAALTEYAHRFYSRVFVTLNTILYDQELAEAEKMIRQLYAIGVDALIVQDPGILRLDLPPVCLHASTQMHNYELERIKFLDRLGFSRIVLARELSLEQIREIRREVKAELEVFVHGALCVSLSGQCYLSQHLFGRSANRGECAQPCRMKWSVEDSRGKILLKDKHVLSLKDLNLSGHIGELIEAGVDSFKIEGRLKEADYVSNITAYYSSLIDRFPETERVSSGKVYRSFDPDPEKSFNRGSSTYFLEGRRQGLVNMDTPKSLGKPLGKVCEVRGNRLRIDTRETLANGDGLCYLANGELKGIRVNKTAGEWAELNEAVSLKTGTMLYRNYDHRFVQALEKGRSVRKIRVSFRVDMAAGQWTLQATDEDKVSVTWHPEGQYEKAEQETQAGRLKQQLMKCGDTEFECTAVEITGEEVLFIPAAAANAARRALLERLREARRQHRQIMAPCRFDEKVPGPASVDWHYNVVNRKSREFYEIHGAREIEEGFEKNGGGKEKELMHTRYCLLYELGRCRKKNANADLEFPLFLRNDKHRFRLDFDCKTCFMSILKDSESGFY